MVALASVVTLFGVAAPAQAATRHVTPTGSTTSTTCAQTDPCQIERAIETVALSGDEVVVAPGDYTASGSPITVSKPLTVHGVDGMPRPRISSTGVAMAVSGTASQGQPLVVRHLRLESSGMNTAALDARQATGSEATQPVFEDLVAVATGSGGRAVQLVPSVYPSVVPNVLRDSVAWSTGPGGVAVWVDAVRDDTPNTPDVFAGLRNVTAVASGTNSVGIMTRGSHESGSCRLGGFLGCSYLGAVDAKNVIARGTTADLYANNDSDVTSPGEREVWIVADYSNFRPAKVLEESPDALVDEGSSNQSAAPLFADEATGDFHQLTGSPTIDAGVSASGIGATDPDGDARVVGAAPDIGADEYVPPAAGGGGDPDTDPGAGSSVGESIAPPNNVFSIAATSVSSKKGTATLTVNLPGPGALDLLATAKVRGSAQARAAKTIKVASRSLSVAAAGPVQLLIKPSRAAKRVLRKKRKLRTSVKLTYTPTGGTPSTQTRSVTFKLRRRR